LGNNISTNCANCNDPLTGLFCSNCGQSVKSRRGPIWHVAAEFSEELFALDSKMFRSIGTLLFKPGVLTARFLNGKRASVLPPVRLYLVISLIFFLVFQIPTRDVSNDNVYIGNVLLGHEKPIKGRSNFSLFSFGEKESNLSRWFERNFEEEIKLIKTENPQVTVDRIFSQGEDILPKILVLFLPLFALVLKISYAFKKILYFDHLLFSLHFQTWLMGVVLIIFGLALQNPWWSALSIVIPIYLAKAQKVVYQQTYWLVIPKTIAILVFYIVLLAIVVVASAVSAIALL